MGRGRCSRVAIGACSTDIRSGSDERASADRLLGTAGGGARSGKGSVVAERGEQTSHRWEAGTRSWMDH